ncbi:MAG: AsmA-like C-terminal region-containing protein, partial [Odoribacter sp.]|nr:AsmA-like C-terminal region-containing protein [Odoribacter sp.]
VSADCKLTTALTPSGTLNLKTADGNGFITSRNILINRNPTLEKLASILKNEELNRINISALKIEFEMQQGNLTIKPFQTTMAGNPATIYGKQSAGGDIDYTIALNVKRKYFGKDIENILKSIPGTHNIESLNLDVNIEGTSEKPEIKPDLSKALKTIRKEAEKELKKKNKKGLMKELNKLFR